MLYRRDGDSEVVESRTYKGMDYMIVSHGTHPCGYVRVKNTHPLYERGVYEAQGILVHGRITYAGEILLTDKPKAWWLGWDYGHTTDYMEHPSKVFIEPNRGGKRWTLDEIRRDCKSVINQLLEQGGR